MGCTPCLSALGRCYTEGIGVVKNLAAALDYYQQAAEHDDAEGRYQIGCAHLCGEIMQSNPERGFQELQPDETMRLLNTK